MAGSAWREDLEPRNLPYPRDSNYVTHNRGQKLFLSSVFSIRVERFNSFAFVFLFIALRATRHALRKFFHEKFTVPTRRLPRPSRLQAL